MLSDSQRDFCKSQAARMSCLDEWPWQPEGQAELSRALHRAAVSEEHARQVIDYVMENFKEIPTPTDIQRIAFELRPKGPNPSLGCPDCKGTGFAQVSHTTKDGMVYMGVKRCSCRAGITAPPESSKPAAGKRELSKAQPRNMFGERD